MRVCLHVASLMSVAIAPMCASASLVLLCSHIPYSLRLLQRDPDQTERYCTVRSASFIAFPFTQTGDTYRTEFALTRKRPDQTEHTAQSAQRPS